MPPPAPNDTGSPSATGFGGHQQLAVAYGVVFALGLAENVAVGSRLLWRLRRSGPACVLRLSLALAAAAFACSLPLWVHYHLHGGDWRFGEPACRLSASLHWAFMYLGTGSLLCLSLDSYLALAHPWARLRSGRTHWAVGSAGLWLLAGAVASPLALGSPLSHTGPNNRTSCFENFVADTVSGSHGTYALVGGFLAPSIIILSGYPLLAWHVASGHRTWRGRRALRTLGFSVLVCAICFLPYSLCHLLRHLGGPGPGLSHLRRAALLLLSLGPCLSPLVGLPGGPRACCRLWARLRSPRPKAVFTICDSKLTGPLCPPLG
ncbi:proteinase-activated receptor 2-like [Sminthopsis crassicaudata]|uniref:proteinase-activated receptor 2-like n=1 Tax=Sminthopsis crassicaudata TaxID=9301 RepID=UPI003D69A606